MHVIGTAGHVDHGKSMLVKALTGIDPDRLKEEKERQMTIDLGFAWLTLPSGEQVGIVDVPGHKDFIENMLAGVGGIDAALLVVAADEGVMPQTREHLAILDLLGVKSGLVALTKVDLVDDPEWLELIKAEVEELLEGTTLADAPIIPVSAKTGQGLPELVAELDALLQRTPPRRDLGRPRLAIDRVFSITGFGTLVTGTLVDGTFELGQEVEILPQGIKARIRGLQTHKRRIERAMPGSRVAINLAGVSKNELRRGDVVTTPGWLKPTQLVDVRLRCLADAPRPLRHNTMLKFFSGSAEVVARARLLDSEAIPPGEEGWVQLRLAKPVALIKGDRFIVRQPSPPLTIGGGVVVDPHPRRHRRFHPEVIERLEALAYGTPQEVLLQFLQIEEPCQARELIERSGLTDQVATEALEELLAQGQVLALGGGGQYLVSKQGWEALLERLTSILGDYHRRNPLHKGMPRGELREYLRRRIRGLSSKLFNEIMTRAASEGKLVEEGAIVRLPEHRVRFTPDQQRRVDQLLAAFEREPYTPPSVAEAQAMVGPEVLNALIEEGRLVKVSEDVIFLAETYEEMVERVIARLRKEGRITVAQVRDMFATSRKYALALMEHLDKRKVTERVGDERVLR